MLSRLHCKSYAEAETKTNVHKFHKHSKSYEFYVSMIGANLMTIVNEGLQKGGLFLVVDAPKIVSII